MNIKHLVKTTAKNVELGIAIERARIIAILKEDDKAVYENGECALDNHWPGGCNCRVIALINGEN